MNPWFDRRRLVLCASLIMVVGIKFSLNLHTFSTLLIVLLKIDMIYYVNNFLWPSVDMNIIHVSRNRCFLLYKRVGSIGVSTGQAQSRPAKFDLN